MFARLHEVHHFTVDAAASAENALLPVFWTREQNALAQSWSAHRVWCNPPYSVLAPWIQKAWTEMQRDCELVVMLLPANRTEQPFWQKLIEPYRDTGGAFHGVRLTTRFVGGRVEFGYPAGTENPRRPTFGVVVVTWERAG